MLKKSFILFLLCIGLKSQATEPNVNVDSILTRKCFPVLSLLDQYNKVLLTNNKVFKGILLKQNNRIQKALTCAEVSCYADALDFSPADVVNIGNELIRLYGINSGIKKTVKVLRSSGCYNNLLALPDTAFLRADWQQAAAGLHQILEVYVKGKDPQYPKIDAISFLPGDQKYQALLKEQLAAADKNMNGKKTFYAVPLRFSLKVLVLNNRDEAARYEPLKGGLNAGPFARVKAVKWDSFKYSIILVPGAGPGAAGVAMSAQGKKRCEQAVTCYKQGLAPFIVVSGGHVHPNKTPFCEAVEMKKYLVQDLGISDDVVIIEPHARHTTSNIRDVNRIIYRFGMPEVKPVLTVTDSSQSSYILLRLDERCKVDFGLVPYKNMKKINDEQNEYYPLINCLQVDAINPLDP